jgi:putative membrane protein
MTDRRERALLAGTAALLGVSLLAHVHFLVTGSEAFWPVVTLAMTGFCLTSSTHLMGWRNALTFLIIGVAVGQFFEALSVHTGFPFGPYFYTRVFGPGLLGIPFIIPFAWYVIVYLSYVLANLTIERRPVVSGGAAQAIWLSIIGAAVVTAYDLSLDPFMVTRIKAWVMVNPGNYFGEQFRGFAGWMLTSFLISVVFRLTSREPTGRVASVSWLAAAYPVAAYGLWAAFFAIAGEPPATRAVAIFAMGIPTLTATSGLLKWQRSRRQADAPVSVQAGA